MQSSLSLTRLFNFINKNPFLYIHLPLIFYWIFLLIMTSIPIEKLPKLFDEQDKFEHFAAYFILGILLKMSSSFQKKSIFLKRNSSIISLIIIIFYGMFDEIHQLIIPGRYCDFFDFLFDFIGGAIGIILIHTLLKKNPVY